MIEAKFIPKLPYFFAPRTFPKGVLRLFRVWQFANVMHTHTHTHLQACALFVLHNTKEENTPKNLQSKTKTPSVRFDFDPERVLERSRSSRVSFFEVFSSWSYQLSQDCEIFVGSLDSVSSGFSKKVLIVKLRQIKHFSRGHFGCSKYFKEFCSYLWNENE